MRQPEGMPEYDVGVFNGAVGAGCFNPSREALRRLAGSLGDMSTSRVDLIVGDCSCQYKRLLLLLLLGKLG